MLSDDRGACQRFGPSTAISHSVQRNRTDQIRKRDDPYCHIRSARLRWQAIVWSRSRLRTGGTIRSPGAALHLTSQYDQLMPEHRVLCLKPDLRLNGEAKTVGTKHSSAIIVRGR